MFIKYDHPFCTLEWDIGYRNRFLSGAKAAGGPGAKPVAGPGAKPAGAKGGGGPKGGPPPSPEGGGGDGGALARIHRYSQYSSHYLL